MTTTIIYVIESNRDINLKKKSSKYVFNEKREKNLNILRHNFILNETY